MSPLVSTFAGAALRPYGFTAGAGGPGPAFELIATTLISSTTSGGVTFSSIPATYTHLQARFVTFADNGYPLVIRFNGDTSSIYSEHDLTGNRSSVTSTSTSGTSGTFAYIFGNRAQHNGGTTIPAVGIVDILDYANTNKYKTARTFSGIVNSSTYEVGLWSANWRSTSAITSVSFNALAGWNFYSGTRISLYGVRGS